MDNLDEIQALWDNTDDGDSKQSGGGGKYVPVPDGEHVAIIKKAGVNTEFKTPALFFELYFPQHNTSETSFNNINAREGAIKALKAQFRGLGLKPKSAHPAELDRVAKSTVGWTIKVKKNTKPNPNGKPYRNFYLNSVVDKPKTAAVDDSDLPF